MNTQQEQLLIARTAELEKELAAKNRELEIEAALERVRARTMAMQHSDELREVVATIYEQLQYLDINYGACTIIIMDKASGNMQHWVGGFAQKIYPVSYQVNYFNHPFIESQLTQWKNGEKYSVLKLSGDSKTLYDKMMFTQTDFKNFPEDAKKWMAALESVTFSIAYMSHGSLTWGPGALSEEHGIILQRFAKVFEQTYTRFLDLQKAEAQAREAQIEVALERVRSRTMAMQHSEDLTEVANLLFQQVQALGVPAWSCGFNIWEEREKCFTGWMSSEGILQPPFKIPLSDLPTFNRLHESRQKGELFYVEEMAGEILAAQYQYMRDLPGFGEILDNFLKSGFTLPTFQINHVANFLQGNLIFITSESVPEAHDIFKRFAKVFEQTYTRFLDLQKAEAQAREAQIQLALERVRAGAMAMRQSGELGQLIFVLYRELTKLDAKLDRCFIMIVNPENKGITWWLAGKEGLLAENGFFIQMNQHPSHLMYLDHWEKRTRKWQYLFEGEEKRDCDKFLFNNTELAKLPVFIQNDMAGVTSIHLSGSSDQFGSLITGSIEPLREEHLEIISRFAVAFNQAYTRFLDLQKAEAQAREAKIEIALEKVRSRAMAMQNSDELHLVIAKIFIESTNLQISLDSGVLIIYDQDQYDTKWWLVNHEDPNYPLSFRVTYNDYPFSQSMLNAWKQKLENWEYVLSGEEKRIWDSFIYAKTDFALLPENIKEVMLSVEHLYINASFNAFGCIMLTSLTPFLKEQLEILPRFSNLFEQTYTRFLDLQKAEAQAREARIEIALEKVRSTSLAIHQSQELEKVVIVLFEKLKELEVPFDSAFIYLFDKAKRKIEAWVASHLLEYPVKVNLPYDTDIVSNPIIVDLWHAIESGEPGLNKSYNEKDKDDYFRYEAKYNQPLIPESITDFQVQAESWITSFATEKNSIIGFDSWHGQLTTSEDFAILKRFAKVFEQAYTRFLDLQKAEAQAREGEIELALERVRARTMAMQKSADLREVVMVLYAQLANLKFQWGAASITIMNATTGDIDWWLEGFGDGYDFPESYHVPFFNHNGHKQQLEYWKNGTTYAVVEISGPEKKSYDNYYFNQTDFINVPVNTKQIMRQQETVLFSMAYMKYGALSWSPTSISSEQAKILQRFAKVFEQTYTRFLDLQKAEAQAREARIETALEKIRGRSLAMHHSVEIKDVVSILFEKLRDLDLVFDGGAAIHLFTEGSRNAVIWVASPELSEPSCVNLPYDEQAFEDNPIILDVWHAKETGANIYNKLYSFEEKNKYFNYVFKHNDFITVPEPSRGFILQAESYTASFIAEKNSLLGANSWTRQLFSSDDFDILKRIAKVFEQAYVRFLDLQKAEAQAREAQIEVALEKIRSRSLAMHHSDELKEVMSVMFKKLTELEILIGTVGILLFDEKTKNCDFWLQNQHQEPGIARLPYDEKMMNGDNYMRDYWDAKTKGESFFNKKQTIEQKNRHFEYVFAHNDIPQPVQEYLLQAQYHTQTFIIEKNSALLVDSWDERIYSVEQIEVLKRVAKVFEQAYIRFLDLQKAEAQAREAQIEVALERVRAGAMAMHHSGEIPEVAHIIWQQLAELKLADFDGCAILVLDEEGTNTYDSWYAFPETVQGDQHVMGVTKYAQDCAWVIKEMFAKYRSGESEIIVEMNPEQINEFLDWVELDNPALTREIRSMNLQQLFLYAFPYSNGVVTSYAFKNLRKETSAVLKRITSVFDMAYRRFRDLQKAEAQAREAQIQLALERVRARGMAMYHSNELADLLDTVFKELTKLDIQLDRCIIMIYDPKTYSSTWWLSNPEPGSVPVGLFVPYHEHKPYLDYLDAWKNRILKWEYLLEGTDKKEWDSFIFKETELSRLPEFVIDGMKSFDHIFLNVSFNNFGSLTVSSAEPLDDASTDLLLRFAKVFDSTYTRFNDLQKAEAQAREAQIQLALERVRAKTMAMQHSGELREIAAAMHEQLQGLGFTSGFCSIVIMDRITGNMTWWMFFPGKEYPESYDMPFFEHPFYLEQLNKWKQGENYSVVEVSGEAKKLYDKHVFSQTEFVKIPIESQQFMMSFEKIIFSNAYMKHGAISWGVEQIDVEHAAVLQRFASVFEQCYTRFLDLQKAEAQAREAQIEVALEKVRSTSLAMHKAEELKNVVAVVFQKLKELGLTFDVSGIQLFTERSKDIVQWVAAPDLLAMPILAYLPFVEKDLLESEILKNFWEAKEMGKSSFNKSYSFVEKNKFFEYAGRYNDFNEIPEDVREFQLKAPGYMLTLVAEKRSALWVDSYSGQTIPSEGFDILKRFARVFEQTYVRFLDLQKAEAQARESQVEAALERVRSRTLAMHNSDELAETAAVVFKQLIGLGIAPNRLYIGIIKDNLGEQIELWSTDEDGTKVSTQFTGNVKRNQSIKTMYEGWKTQKKSITIDMQGKELEDYFHYLSEELKVPFQLSFTQKRRVQTIAYFSQGFIGMASTDLQPDETKKLLERFAYVFNLTFTRFNDLKIAEAHALQAEQDLIAIKEAKQKAEEALTELQATQKQLIQSEKMASLGELTAGIAHEIQNPLNFVNNFSEVSNELIDEMNEELNKGDIEEAKAIASDIQQNLEKITHHGKRAEAIVKGMLQHSRTSSGQKELTDINALADEYLRLAYHGLRAKDKSFNAEINTDFDETIGKINVIPQDFGRVILNLITNAFYTTNEKSRQSIESYKPMVSVSTKKVNDKIEIKVSDNGNGIPQKIVDKIFQPFFTTKPTGQGTGLGLSLSYDIVKAHGAEIKVQSKEGEGTTFTLQLPV